MRVHTWLGVTLAAALTLPGVAQVSVGIIGTNNPAAIATLLTGAGHTVTQYGGTVPPAGTLASLDTVILLRTNGNADLQNWVQGGGRLITEWSAANWALNTASLLAAADSGGTCLGNPATDVTFVNPGVGLNAGMNNPYNDYDRTHCFRNLTGIGAGVTVEANRPPGPVPCILSGPSGGGFVIILGYDWADGFGSANADTRQLILNAVEYGGGASCTATGPLAPVTTDVDVTVDSSSYVSPTVDVLFEYSLDGGVTYLPCTASAASLFPNPALGIPTGPQTFTWASRDDYVGTPTPAVGVLVRATVDDGVSTTDCETAPFDVDNSLFCGGTCGDCNQDQQPAVDILDALVAAQIGAFIITASNQQMGCCDVDANTVTDILDALLIAQEAAVVPVTLACL